MKGNHGRTTVALLTRQTGELTLEFAMNEDGAVALTESLQFLIW